MNAISYRQFENCGSTLTPLPPAPTTTGKAREILLELYRANTLSRRDLRRRMIERATEIRRAPYGRVSRWWTRTVWNPLRVRRALSELTKLKLIKGKDTFTLTPLGYLAAL